MNAEIIAIGDEILSGKTVDTNSSQISKILNTIGIKTSFKCSISDKEEIIVQQLETSLERSEIVIITGGLGPTNDDVTMYTLAKYFDSKVVKNEFLLAKLKDYFASRNRVLDPLNHTQANFPEKAEMILNDRGTATGMLFRKGKKLIFSMPGVPHEMLQMMQGQVRSILQEEFELEEISIKDIQTIGISEARLATIINAFELEKNSHFSLAYLPKLGRVTVRFYYKNNPESIKAVEDATDLIIKNAGEYIYDLNGLDIAEAVGAMLLENKQNLSVAESCTGGYLGHLITSIPGSSNYFEGGNIVYSNNAKMKELGVPVDVINNKGAVSEEVVKYLSENVRQKYSTNYGIAISGIAGPSGATETKSIGTVCIGIASKDCTITRTYTFSKIRKINIELSAIHALRLLWKYYLSNK